jgi:putative ABC transport system substrate-binding protein
MRKIFMFLPVIAVLGGAAVQAQQSKKVPRIGYLSAGNSNGEPSRSGAIRQALRENGYIEGQNVSIEYRYAEGKFDRAPELASELVRLKVDLILVSAGGRYLQAVKNATKTIPILMVGAGVDPVDAGVVESLARPGANVTGITNIEGKLGGKRLEVLKEAVGKVSRVAVIYDPASQSNDREAREELPSVAHALKLTVRSWEIRDANSFEKTFTSLNNDRPDGLYVLSSPLMRAYRKEIVDFTLKSRLPSMYTTREAVEIGGLMSYGADLADSYRRVAYFVDRILNGAKPADLPVEQPTKFELVINLKTTKQIGLTIPQKILSKADKVIK